MKATKYTGYYVTEDGRVFKELKQHDTNGYKAVNIHDGQRNKLERVHRLVAGAYLGESSLVVNHIDGDKHNNNLSNLEYVTYGENNTHAKRLGLNKNIGETSHYAKLTEAEAIQLIKEYRAGATAKEMAAKYGIGAQTVYAIVNGRRWKHLSQVEGSQTIESTSKDGSE